MDISRTDREQRNKLLRSTSRAPCGSNPLFQAPLPGRVGAAFVTFEPCARSDWHTHPLGQTLIVTFGCGLHQRWGGPIRRSGPATSFPSDRTRSIGTVLRRQRR